MIKIYKGLYKAEVHPSLDRWHWVFETNPTNSRRAGSAVVRRSRSHTRPLHTFPGDTQWGSLGSNDANEWFMDQHNGTLDFIAELGRSPIHTIVIPEELEGLEGLEKHHPAPAKQLKQRMSILVKAYWDKSYVTADTVA